LKIKLGWGYDQRYIGGWSSDPKDLETAFRYAQEGLAGNLPPLGKGLGHWLMADLLAIYKRDFDKAMDELDLVRRLMPNDLAPIIGEGNIPVQAGKPEIAIAALKDITPQDPEALVGRISPSRTMRNPSRPPNGRRSRCRAIRWSSWPRATHSWARSRKRRTP
jgi:hypothetical protein